MFKVRVLNRNNVRVECMCVFNNNVRVDLLEEVRVKKNLYVYNKKMCVYVFACVCTCSLKVSAGVFCLFSPIATSSLSRYPHAQTAQSQSSNQ